MYRVQKELVENGNGKAIFDFSLVTAFRVVENVSEKYLEEGFGAENTQEKSKKHPRNEWCYPRNYPRNYFENNERKTGNNSKGVSSNY